MFTYIKKHFVNIEKTTKIEWMRGKVLYANRVYVVYSQYCFPIKQFPIIATFVQR